MFGLFKPKKPLVPDVLHFKSSRDAFEYACEYMAPPLEFARHAGAPNHDQFSLIGFVHGEASEGIGFFSCEKYYDVSLAVKGAPVRVPKCSSLLVKVARNKLPALHNHVAFEPPRPGDLVLVEVGTYLPDYPPDHVMNHFIICFRLKPELVVARRSFQLELSELF